MISSLSLALMLLTTVIPFLEYALPAIAGLLLVIMVIEISRKWAFASFFTVSLLSFIILPNKEVALMYAAFFGYYPILKSLLESKLGKVLEYILKFVIFNLSFAGAILLSVYVLKIPFDEMEKFGWIAIPIFMFFANIMFILYDYTLTQLVFLYMEKLRKGFRRIFR